MKASQVRCPNCRAGLRPTAGAATVTCEYCGTQSRLGAPTIFGPSRPALDPALAALPVARRRVHIGWYIFVVYCIGACIWAIWFLVRAP